MDLEVNDLYLLELEVNEGFNFPDEIFEQISSFVVSSTNLKVQAGTKITFNSSSTSSSGLSVSAGSSVSFSSTVDSQTNIIVDLGEEVFINTSVSSSSSLNVDIGGDTPVITSTEDTYTQSTSIPITVTFGDVQTGFTSDDLIINNGSVNNFTDDGGGVYTFDLVPVSDGACTIDINADVCTDSEGNGNEAADQFTIYHDTTAPTANTTTTIDNITTDGYTVNYNKATDLVSDNNLIRYELWSSLSNNITTVADALANGTKESEGVDVNTLSLDGKIDGDEVWSKVLAYDQAGNILGYDTVSETIADGISPTISSPGISTEEVGEHTFDMVYQEASDNVTAHADMKYHGYTSESDNLNSVADAEANGTFHETVTGELRITCDGLDTDTTYYGQIIAEDEDGNKSIYDAVEQKTAKFGDAVLSQAQIFT